MIKTDDVGGYLKRLEGTPHFSELEAAAYAVVEAGNKIYNSVLEKKAKIEDSAKIKEDSPAGHESLVGHHSIIVPQDLESQNIIIDNVLDRFPHAYFLSEERGGSSQLLTEDNYQEHIDKLVFCVDPICGSSSYANGLYEWSVSVGVMEGMEPIASAIYAPRVNGSMLFFGNTSGAYVVDDGDLRESKVAKDKPWERRMVQHGVDIPFMSEYMFFINEVAELCKTINMNGSCPLPLGLTASGANDVLVWPRQGTWDYFAGAFLVEQSGGKVQFYTHDEDEIILVDKPKIEHYNPGPRNIGFVAGNSKAVDETFEMLVGKYGRIDEKSAKILVDKFKIDDKVLEIFLKGFRKG